MTANDKVIEILKSIEQQIANAKEISRREDIKTHGCLLELEETLAKVFVCVEGDVVSGKQRKHNEHR